MIELPLFPLNTVLFPGMPLNLHIFEERYKQMINECIDNRRPFGVVLIRRGAEALGPLAEPYEVGCTARVLEVERLEEGRLNITALGESRFRVLSLRNDRPYLVGQVELLPVEQTDPLGLVETVLELRPWVQRYMQILDTVSDINLDPAKLPGDPLVLAYLAAVLLQVPPVQKQKLLAFDDVSDLLHEMTGLYRREVALLQALVTEAKTDEENLGFSIN